MGGDYHGHLLSPPDSSSFCVYDGSYGETTIEPDDLISEASALLRDGGSKEVRDGQFGISGKLEVGEDILEEDGSITAAFDGYDDESRMRQGAYREVLKFYDNLRVNDETIALAREKILGDSDDSDLRSRIKYKARGKSKTSSVKRMINFVIFVVNGLAVLKSMDKNQDPLYSELASAAYKCPFPSFKDDKPAVVITHGDLLSISERARVRIYLGELLGIHPAKQIFDIPDTDDLASALATVDMLRYCLEHADRNLLLETTSKKKVWEIHASAWMYILAMVVIAVIFACLKQARHPLHPHHHHIRVDWPQIRHLWLG